MTLRGLLLWEKGVEARKKGADTRTKGAGEGEPGAEILGAGQDAGPFPAHSTLKTSVATAR